MATSIHPDTHTINREWKQYCTSLVNKCRRRGNKTGKPKGDKTKGVKPLGKTTATPRSRFALFPPPLSQKVVRILTAYTKVGRASRSLSAAKDAFQCTLSSKSVASQKQRNFLETQRNFLSSKRSFPSLKSVACVFVHNC